METVDVSRKILKLGIGFYNEILKRQINFAPIGLGDFTHSFIVKCPPKGNDFTKSHDMKEFHFIIVAPIGFSKIHEILMLSQTKVLSDITKNELAFCAHSYFDKNCILFNTTSGRYNIQKISDKELRIIISYLYRYYQCAAGMSHSFIPKLLGIYSYKFTDKKNSKMTHFLLKDVKFPPDFKIHKQFELFFGNKFSKVETHSAINGLNEFKYNHPDGFLMNMAQRKKIIEILEHDFEFLRILRLLRYSLRIAVHNFNLSKREMDDEIKNIRKSSQLPRILKPFDTDTINANNMKTQASLSKIKQQLQDNQKLEVINRRSSPAGFTSSSDTPSLVIMGPSKESKKNFEGVTLNKEHENKSTTYLFNSSKLQSDFYKAKRHGGIFVYDVKGEHLAIFLSFGHIYDKTEDLYTYKSFIKSTFQCGCSKKIITIASYADQFESFLIHQAFRPVKQDMTFEPWPDEGDHAFDKAPKIKPSNPLDKWANIKARLISESTDDDSSEISERRTLSAVDSSSD